MSVEIVAAIVSGLGVIAASIAWGIRYIAKHIVVFLKELKPNGGHSIKDQVNRLDLSHDRLDTRLDAVETKIDMLTEAFKDYIKGK